MCKELCDIEFNDIWLCSVQGIQQSWGTLGFFKFGSVQFIRRFSRKPVKSVSQLADLTVPQRKDQMCTLLKV
ncbi:hypothetical protein Sjap_006106 [Stephania japonica]|uniref:Uncharacterized protein n=1 Tax=Stephania japonica TaxID=461633 RepID=A0AAP0K584_9MAGN